jgi:hypothetical protein
MYQDGIKPSEIPRGLANTAGFLYGAVETFENRHAISPRTKTNSRSEPAEPATNDDGMTHDLRSI